MKIHESDANVPKGLRISETKAGEVYYYRPIDAYVIRISGACQGWSFVGLRSGGLLEGADFELFPVEAVLEVKR